MRDEKQIAEEIEKLKDIKERVRPTTFFGDSNTDAVAAQIEVLERGMDTDDIYDFFEYADHLLEAALAAYYWAEEPEDDEEAPSVDWEPLCKPKEETE